ncbi:MAG: hypothetical protein QM692_17665 [Thermomicrobiales bacterium]
MIRDRRCILGLLALAIPGVAALIGPEAAEGRSCKCACKGGYRCKCTCKHGKKCKTKCVRV